MVSTREIAQQTNKLEITLDYKRRRNENVQWSHCITLCTSRRVVLYYIEENFKIVSYTTLHCLRRSKSVCTTLHYERRRKNCTTMHEKKKHYYMALHRNTQGKKKLLHYNALQLHRITTQKVVWALRIFFSKIIREKSNESLREGTQDLKDRKEMEWEFMKSIYNLYEKKVLTRRGKKGCLDILTFNAPSWMEMCHLWFVPNSLRDSNVSPK